MSNGLIARNSEGKFAHVSSGGGHTGSRQIVTWGGLDNATILGRFQMHLEDLKDTSFLKARVIRTVTIINQ